jgi:hypothetical protein
MHIDGSSRLHTTTVIFIRDGRRPAVPIVLLDALLPVNTAVVAPFSLALLAIPGGSSSSSSTWRRSVTEHLEDLSILLEDLCILLEDLITLAIALSILLEDLCILLEDSIVLATDLSNLVSVAARHEVRLYDMGKGVRLPLIIIRQAAQTAGGGQVRPMFHQQICTPQHLVVVLGILAIPVEVEAYNMVQDGESVAVLDTIAVVEIVIHVHAIFQHKYATGLRDTSPESTTDVDKNFMQQRRVVTMRASDVIATSAFHNELVRGQGSVLGRVQDGRPFFQSCNSLVLLFAS